MFLKHLSIAFLLAGVAVSAHAAGNAKKPKAEPRGDDVVCTYEQPVGTHIKRRICATRADRAERTRKDQEAMQRMRGPGAPQGAGSSGN